jgi:FkbM family methyltransferase
VIFDVGANVGNFTGLVRSRFPRAIIHAFEPHPVSFAALQARTTGEPLTKSHNIAAGAASGTLTLYDRADQSGSEHASLHHGTITEVHHQNTAENVISVDTLDNVAEREGIAYIHFIKIDTEGHEHAVLSGASRLLREQRIGLLQFEFNELNVFSRTFFRDFRTLLPSYDFFRLLPRGLLPLTNNIVTTEIFAFQNILAVPKDPSIGPRDGSQ